MKILENLELLEIISKINYYKEMQKNLPKKYAKKLSLDDILKTIQQVHDNKKN